jgi:hypothetical protein
MLTLANVINVIQEYDAVRGRGPRKMCQRCEDALANLMAWKVYERRIALSVAAEADRPARLADLRAAEHAQSLLQPIETETHLQVACPYAPCAEEAQVRVLH